MRLFISLIILLVSAKPAPRCEVYTSITASDAWITTTRQLPLRQQVAAVRQRLACDARVRGRVPAANVCVSCLTAEGQRAHQAALEKQRQAEAADPRPLGVVLFYMIDGRIVAPSDAAQWQPFVTWQRVREIKFWASDSAAAIGGTRAQDGLVVITSKQP